MLIKLYEIPVSELIQGYKDDNENGVVGFGGQLNIRPKFQREFIYDEKQRNEVIKTIKKGFPLNTMYWIITSDDGDIKNLDNINLHDPKYHYELLDGQQRTISICKYCNGDFSIDCFGFYNLTQQEQQEITDYKLMVYICCGNDKEKLNWFEVINIAGEELTKQELRNAIYTGNWITDAKKYFSKTQCPAYQIGQNYMNGKPIRQDYLQTVLSWISSIDELSISDYMAKHQFDDNASYLWSYFQQVISWIKATFPVYRNEMKGIQWGFLYNKYKNNIYDTDALEKQIQRLLMDEDVSNHKGIYEYLLDNNEKHLNIRTFTSQQKLRAFTRQGGKCIRCGKVCSSINEMEADHITPWSKGGHTTDDNLQMLCIDCNRKKSSH